MNRNCFFIAIVAILMSVAFNACKDDKKDPVDPKVDPSTIAADNLIAYFPFDGNGNDEIGNLTPSNAATSKVTYPDGRRGKSFEGAPDGSVSGLLYALPANSKLRDLKAFSFSIWMKMVPNTIETTDAPEQMVFHVDGTGDWIWGNLFFLQHRNWPLGETERDLKFAEMDCYFWKEDATVWKGQRGNGWFLDVVTTPQWRHIICTYDNVSSEFHAYVNGIHVTAFDGTPYTGVNRLQEEDGAPLGDLKFTNAEHLAIGAWCDRLRGESLVDDAWAASFKGQLDEFRIYDRALTATEAKELYDAEAAQVEE